MKIVPLAEGDHFFSKRTDFLRLWKCGHQTAMIKEIRHEIPKQCAAMRTVAAQFPVCIPMSHTVCSVGGGITGRPCSSGFIPSESPMLPRISLISFSDLRPKFFVF